MNNPFGNKMPDAQSFANDQASKAQGLGEGKLNDTKGFGNSFSSPAGNKGAGSEKAPSFSEKGGDNKMPGASGMGGSSSSGAGGKDGAALSGGASQSKESPMGVSDKSATGSSGPQAAAGSPGAPGSSSAPKSAGINTKKTKPKTYTVKSDEDLGIIAKKFRLPSWKYLYQLNKDKIGDNPDLLKAGTELTIPQWDSTKGDELIKEKGGNPMAYTGGLQYRYPWVPFSLSLVGAGDQKLDDFKEETELLIYDSKTKKEIVKKKIKKSDEIEMLLPDSEDIRVGIKGLPYKMWGFTHRHPDDEASEKKEKKPVDGQYPESDA